MSEPTDHLPAPDAPDAAPATKRPRAPRARKPSGPALPPARETSQDLPGRGVHITGCLRCGNDHDIVVHDLTHVTPQGWNQWGLCPVYAEPVFFISPAQQAQAAEAVTEPVVTPTPAQTPVPAPVPRPVHAHECGLCCRPLAGPALGGEATAELFYEIRYDIPNAYGRQSGHYRVHYHSACFTAYGARVATMLDAAGAVNFNLVTLGTASLPRPE